MILDPDKQVTYATVLIWDEKIIRIKFHYSTGESVEAGTGLYRNS